MTTPPTVHEFAADLVARLKQTKTIASGAYYLDLRHRTFGDGGRVVLKCPDDPQWPNKGRTTRDEREAKRWIRERYAPHYYMKLRIADGGVPERDDSVRAACERYIADRTRDLGPEHNTVKNRASQIREHIIPAFGDLPFTALHHARVRPWLNGLMVRRPDKQGALVTRPAAPNTKRNLRTTLLAIWRHAYPDVKQAPFSGIWLDPSDDMEALRKKVEEGNIEELLAPASGAMSPAKFRRVITAALWSDRTRIAARPNMRAISIANTAVIIALLVATGMRLGELLKLRWWMIRPDEGYILVPGVKTKKALRAVPLQEQLRPWIELLREMESPAWGGAIPGDAFVIRTNPRRLDKKKPASRKSVMSRVAEVLQWAGHKPPRKATHWARATHATWGSVVPDIISTEALKAYLGHESPYGGATDDYIATLVGLMPLAHRGYIRHLPSPQELQAEVAEFQPTVRPSWKERGLKRRPKSPEAAARREAAQADRLAALRARTAG